ncbi:MAG: DNA-directed RNA polymerase subunit D [Candidatus Diapherotrites archaeon]|nr:DNA-directed RNA polymerase subunit D [Candidatus Diapherotrites archaeon]
MGFMDVKKISEQGREVKLLVSGSDTPLLNAVRRTILNNVPTLAIESVWVYENNSVMPDEMLSHRMAMLPIAFLGKGKPDTAKFALEKEGPGMVYSGDITCTTANAEIVDKKIPLVLLGKNQRVKTEMEGILGTGKQHVKWQSASIAYYQVPQLSFERVKDTDAITKAFPNALEVKAKKLFLADPYNAKQATEIRDRFPNEVNLEFDEKSFVLSVESNGGRTNAEILEAAIESLKEKNQEFKEALKSL